MAKRFRCWKCGVEWSIGKASVVEGLCFRCYALQPCCRICEMIFDGRNPASEKDPTLCPDCYAEEQAKRQAVTPPPPPSATEIEWPDPAELVERTEAIDDSAEALAAAIGEGRGPDDEPRLTCEEWDEDGPEKMARIRRYHADVTAGRRIAFIDAGRELAGRQSGVQAWPPRQNRQATASPP